MIVPTCHSTHSLTHCCAWPAKGRSVLHIERSWPVIQAAPTDRPMSSSSCCSQFLCGRPGWCFQSAAGGVPVWASFYSCSACEAGVFSGRRQMWPNNEWRLSAIRDGTSGSFVLSLRWIPCHTIWYQGYDAVPACEKTGSCHCLLCALSTFQNHICFSRYREVYDFLLEVCSKLFPVLQIFRDIISGDF